MTDHALAEGVPVPLSGSVERSGPEKPSEFRLVPPFLGFFCVLVLLLILSDGLLPASAAADILVGTACLMTAVVLIDSSLLAALGMVAVFGATQAAAVIWFPATIVLYLDDLPFFLVAGTSILLAIKWRFTTALWLLGITLLLIAISLARAANTSAGVYQARQILVPILIAFTAYVAAKHFAKSPRYESQIRLLMSLVLALTAATAVYMLAEHIWGPPLNPLIANSFNTVSRHRSLTDGYLGNYLFYSNGSGPPIVRLGGLVMNPPVAGIFMGSATVITFWQYWHKRGLIVLILCAAAAVATFGTYSRAGILVAVVGIGVPVLLRFFNRTVTGLVALVFAVYIGRKIGQEGLSALHYEGFLGGLNRALHHPLGQGLGAFGNASGEFASTQGEGESLAAIPFAAIGLPAVGLYIAAVWVAFRNASTTNWMAALGLGMLLCALFTESASALSGTVFAWTYCGIGFALATQGEEAGQRTAAPSSEPAVVGPHVASPVSSR
jgi:hypothetical protein